MSATSRSVLNSTRRRRLLRAVLIAAAGTVVLTTCAVQELVPPEDVLPFGGSEPSDDVAPSEAPTPSETTPSDTAPPCRLLADVDPVALREAAGDGSLSAADAVTAAIDCAEQVVFVPADDPALAAVAVPLAVSSQAPLLIGDATDLAEALTDVGDPEIRELDRDGVGDDDVQPIAEVALAVADELGVDRFVAAPVDQPNLLAGAAALALRTDAAVLPVDAETPLPELPAGAEVTTIGDLAAQLPEATPADAPWVVDEGAAAAWLVDPADPAAAPTVTVAALRGDTVVPVSGGDLLARRNVGRVRDAGLDASALVPVGGFRGDPSREVVQLAEAPLLPGGTLRLFDGTRMVAVYGRPGVPGLGVLGEQDLDATIDRVREVGAGYDADGRDVVPTLEIIVTVASRDAQHDDSYSAVGPPEQFEEWVDRAGEEGMQVILDLQPGRTDFLTQARIYEDLLRRPHVGLALDPEWRLEDDQVHLRQIGGVDAAEVQQVVDWLAALTREEGLTHKLLVLHQFRLSMVRDRDRIEVPPELAVVVHADGQGPQSMKLETWRTLTAGAEDRWHWGWKNFYDEDPVVAEPEYVLDLEPDVDLVTFQ